MATITSGLITFEEFERLPDHTGKQELLEGELIELPPPKKRHNKVGQRIFIGLYDLITRAPREKMNPALGDVYHEMGYRVTRNPDSWLIPEVSVTHPGQSGEDYYEGAPLLPIEVVSPSNAAEQIADKVKLYLANGAREVWAVYPKMHSVWVYREGTYTVVTGTLKTDMLPQLSLDLANIFAD
jgi:Uma2 family endonuclease